MFNAYKFILSDKLSSVTNYFTSKMKHTKCMNKEKSA